MNLNFTSEQDMLRDSAGKFLTNECPYEKVKEIEESEEGYSSELWQKMMELGWLGLSFPEEYGGYGGEFTDLVIIQEEIGKMACPSPYFSTIVQAGFTLLEGATEDQKKDLLPQIAEGSMIISVAQYDEDAGYEETSVNMPATPDGDNYILNGTKMFALDANIANKLIVAARTDEGVTLFLTDADAEGITVSKIPTIAMDNTCEVIFDNVKVAKSDILGTAGQGWAVLEKMNEKAAVAKAAEMLGASKVCIDMTSAYSKERVQYGKPIGGYQALQHMMSNMLIAYDTTWNYLYRVAYLIDEGENYSLEVSVLKATINENFKYITDRAVQIHGGIATTRECDVALFFRRAKSWEFIAGDTDTHMNRVAETILKEIPTW